MRAGPAPVAGSPQGTYRNKEQEAMKEMIGMAAGKIWKALSQKDAATISQIPKLIKEKDSLAYQALGWLAREGKIEYRTQGNKTYVSLNKE